MYEIGSYALLDGILTGRLVGLPSHEDDVDFGLSKSTKLL